MTGTPPVPAKQRLSAGWIIVLVLLFVPAVPVYLMAKKRLRPGPAWGIAGVLLAAWVIAVVSAQSGQSNDPAPGAGKTPAASAPVATAPTSTGATSPAEPPPVSPSPEPSTTAPDPGTALAALRTLAVKGPAPMTGYSRDQFGPAWTDNTTAPGGHNGCDTRDDILAAQMTHISKAGACDVTAATMIDPYTGKPVTYIRGRSVVDIDHVVALGNAWRMGAQRWPAAKRREFANDPYNLLAVSAPANRQKGDGDAATWLPPNKGFRCAYVARQAGVKARYGLAVTKAEKQAITRVLATCPAQKTPSGPQPRRPSGGPVHTPAPPPPTKPPPPPRPAPRGCTTTSTGTCIQRGRFCPQASYGTTGHDASGTPLRCGGDSTHPHWQ